MDLVDSGKNSYLRRTITDINPRIINRMVDKHFSRQSSPANLEPPFLQLETTLPNVFAPNVDPTKSKLAYGNWGLPILKSELQDSNPDVVRMAVNTLSDLVWDPEKMFEALRLCFVPSIAKLLERDDEFIQERCCIILKTFASQSLGMVAIIYNRSIIKHLRKLLHHDNMSIKMKACVTLETISRYFKGAVKLRDMHFIEAILEKIIEEPDEIAEVNLKTLQRLFDGPGEIKEKSIGLGSLDIMQNMILIHYSPVIISRSLACIATLLTHETAKKIASETELLAQLSNCLYYEETEIQTQATAVFMFGTITTAGKLQAAELDIVHRLILFTKNFHCPVLQINAIKVLTNIAETPRGRAELLEQHISKIENIPTNCRSDVKGCLSILLNAIRWKP